MKANQFHTRRGIAHLTRSGILVVCAVLLSVVGLGPTAAMRVQAEEHARQAATCPLPQARMAPVAIGQGGPMVARPVLQTPVPTLTLAEKLLLLESQLDAAWNAQDWALVLTLISQIIALDPSYDDIQTRLYYAHVNYGYQYLASLKCTEAKEQFTLAAALRPSGQEAQTALALLPTYCPTGPTVAAPTLTFTPAPTSAISPTPTPHVITGPIRYVVQPGDTLYSLAKRYGTTVQAIMQANGLMAPVLHVGETITIVPAKTPAIGPIVHIVQPGETLRSIAELYNTTVWAIMAANGMKRQTLYAYQAIFVPSPMEQGPIIHMTIPGETLVSIAEIYSTTVPLLMLANGLDSYSLHVYQLLVIPPEGWTGGPLPFPVPWAKGPGPSGPPSPHDGPHEDRFYIVQRNDTLFSISRRYGCSVEALKAANGLSGSTIYVGQRLRIP